MTQRLDKIKTDKVRGPTRNNKKTKINIVARTKLGVYKNNLSIDGKAVQPLLIVLAMPTPQATRISREPI